MPETQESQSSITDIVKRRAEETGSPSLSPQTPLSSLPYIQSKTACGGSSSVSLEACFAMIVVVVALVFASGEKFHYPSFLMTRKEVLDT